MSSILTNSSAMTALSVLRKTNNELSVTQNRIATGLKVGSSKDNASFWAVSQVMKSDVGAFKAIGDNLSLAENSTAVARVGAEKIGDLISQIKEKVTSAQDGSLDKAKLQADIDSMLSQIAETTKTANFNGVNLLESNDTVKLLSSLSRNESGVAASYISFEAQNLSFGKNGGLAAIDGLSVLNRGESVVSSKTDGVAVMDMGGLDMTSVSVATSAFTFDTDASDNDFTFQYKDAAGTNQTITVSNAVDGNDLASKMVGQQPTIFKSATWDSTSGKLSIQLKDGLKFTDIDAVGGNGADVTDSLTAHTGLKGNEISFTYKDANNVSRTLKHTLTQDITADSDGAQKLADELNANSSFSKLFAVNYDTTTSTFKISNASREVDATLTGWSGGTFQSQGTAVRLNASALTLATDATDNDFSFKYTDADGSEQTISVANAADMDAVATQLQNHAAVKSSTWDSSNGLTIVFEGGKTFSSVSLPAAAQSTEAVNASYDTLAEAAASSSSTADRTSSMSFQDAPLRLGEEVSLNYTLNGTQKTVSFKVTGDDTATGTRLDDQTNPNKIVLALDARQVTHDGTTGSQIATEIKNALAGSAFTGATGFGLSTGAAATGTNIKYEVANNKLTLTAAAGFDNIGTATLPSTDYQALLDNIESAYNNAINAASTLGSAQARFDIQKDFISSMVDNLKIGIGTLVDADMNEESARLQALQVQQQLGIQSLSIANQAPQMLLSLFR